MLHLEHIADLVMMAPLRTVLIQTVVTVEVLDSGRECSEGVITLLDPVRGYKLLSAILQLV